MPPQAALTWRSLHLCAPVLRGSCGARTRQLGCCACAPRPAVAASSLAATLRFELAAHGHCRLQLPRRAAAAMPAPEWDMRALTRRAHDAWDDSVAFAQHLAGRAAPFASHAAVSAAAYTATLASAQVRRRTRSAVMRRA